MLLCRRICQQYQPSLLGSITIESAESSPGPALTHAINRLNAFANATASEHVDSRCDKIGLRARCTPEIQNPAARDAGDSAAHGFDFRKLGHCEGSVLVSRFKLQYLRFKAAGRFGAAAPAIEWPGTSNSRADVGHLSSNPDGAP